MDVMLFVIAIVGIVGVFFSGANYEREGGFSNILLASCSSFLAVWCLAEALLLK